MKKDIHPTYYPEAKVRCACGNTFTIGSTKSTLEVEVCSNCHPFYTGQDKLMDKVGRIQKFRERLAKKEVPKSKKAPTSAHPSQKPLRRSNKAMADKKVKKSKKTNEPRTGNKRVQRGVRKTH